MAVKCMVELAGSFYSYELYSADGEHISDLMEAAEAAEEQFEDGWQCVYNGNEAMEREEYLER